MHCALSIVHVPRTKDGLHAAKEGCSVMLPYGLGCHGILLGHILLLRYVLAFYK